MYVSATRFLVALLSTLLLLSVPPFSSAQQAAASPFIGRVIAITPANSVIIKTEQGTKVQVVLAFLSIPLGEQPYAERAHQILRSQLLNRRVSVRPIGSAEEQYQLGLIYIGDQNFNLDFLSRGHAWVDYFQVSHPSWLVAQQRAREAGAGLYADPGAQHPHRWSSEVKKAMRLVDAANTMASETGFLEAIKATFIGNRSLKIFVPMPCIAVWSGWRQTDLVPLLTVAGAEDSGFQQISCS